jgi:hypothetical protein
MLNHPRLIRTAIGSIATAALTFGILALSPAGAAFAATQTLIAEQPTVASPVAGQMLTMQISTGSVDGSFPAGELTVGIEGTGMSIGGPANTSTGVLQMNVGMFPLGAVIVDATFTPASSAYSPTSTRVQVIIVGASDSLSPLFPTPPALGHPVTVSSLLLIAAGDTHAPGGVISFGVNGVSVGSCTPAATGAARNWSCSATLPAPTKAGPYTVTAQFGRSSYYLPATGSLTVNIAAAAAPAPVKHAAAAAPAPVATATPGTPTPTATATVPPTSAASAAPLASAANTTDVRSSVPSNIDPWAVLFLILIALLLVAGIGTLLVLRRRRSRAATSPPA